MNSSISVNLKGLSLGFHVKSVCVNLEMAKKRAEGGGAVVSESVPKFIESVLPPHPLGLYVSVYPCKQDLTMCRQYVTVSTPLQRLTY